MKKVLFVWILALSFIVFSFGDAFAKRAKKVKPVKAPVATETEVQNEIQEPVINNEQTSETIQNKETSQSEDVQQKAETPVVEIEPVAEKKAVPVVNLINPCTEEIEKFFSAYSEMQNKHNLAALKKVYTEDFINTDGYNKSQLFALMSRTFGGYPDMKTEYEVKNIVSTGHYAMVNVRQNVSATTKDTSKITKDKGTYKATLETVFYLKKTGKDWKIYSETVQSEVSTLAYGMARDVQAVINAPNKVAAGEDYSASVRVAAPDGYSAIASINTAQVVEGYNMNGETFRQVPPDGGSVERVLRANDKNNNEAVVVSVGFTKLTQDLFKKATLDIAGLMILMQRVDIIPQNTNYSINKEKNENK